MNFKKMTDTDLLKDMLYWTNKERETLSNVLWRLKEIEERKLYSTIKCSSLFDYCVKILKYSEGEASRRVSACRMLQQLPEISVQIENGDINLSQLNQLKQFFSTENIQSPDIRKEVLKKVEKKTTRETEKILWGMQKVETPRKIIIQLKEETVLELKKLQALKAHSCPDMDALLIKMAVEVNKIWDPTIYYRRRNITEGNTRYVQVQVKSKVWERDKGICTNCGSSHGIELDHIMPFGAGGKTTFENLRLLYKSCNFRKGVEFYGARAMNQEKGTRRSP
ncbi:MAG TPA: HNH endonuclease signature motif containing protein [Bacteriovoracaceae bacterium]|nr:HNH endonuclease signature motif containing protein [Bacteriovoracaceae bacterium]